MRRSVWLCLVLIGGCAHTPLGRSVEQTLQVDVPGCPPMRCELSNDRGSWVVPATPGSVVVLTSAQALTVRCAAPASAPGTVRLSSSQTRPKGDAAVAGALIGGGAAAAAAAPAFALGGPFGLLAGTLVVIGAAAGGGIGHTADAASQPFSYPPVVHVAVACPAPPEAAALPAARWGLAVRGAVAGDGAPAGSVWVTALAPQGRAAAAGLQVGDLVLTVDGRPLAGTLDLEEALAPSAGQRSTATLGIRRGAAALQIVLPLEAAR